MLGFSSGLGFYIQSVLLEALTSERGFAVASASFATTIFFLASGIAGLGVAVLIERFDARFSIAAGVLVAAASLALVGRVREIWQLYLLFALFGCGFAGANMVTGTTLVTRWFARRRPLALAVAATGLSVGGIVITPIAAGFIDRLGLERSTPWLAVALILGVIPLTLFMLRDRPEVLGLRPDGAPPESPDAPAATVSTPFRTAVRSRFFLGVTGAYAFGLMAQVGGIAHQFKWITDQADNTVAAAGVSTLAGASIFGRLIASGFLGRFAVRAVAIVLALAQAMALGLLGQVHGAVALLLASALFGLTVGSFLLMRPLLIAEAFGVGSYARIYSFSNVLASLGVAAGPAVLGLLHDYAGGYPTAYLAAAGGSLIAGGCLVLAGPIASA